MLGNLKALGFTAAAVAAVLVPLYGDPRSSPVTHSEWARMLLRALELDEVTPPGAPASRAFTTLSWRNSLAYSADRYVRGEGVEVVRDGGRPRVVATEAAGEVEYTLGVARGGDYRVRVRMAGDPQAPASVEITEIGETKPRKSFAVVPASASGWIEVGSAHLDPGAYTASLLLPAGTTLENVEVAPPCLSPIEPPRGWQALKVLDREDLAVTALKALELESELPPADSAIELTGSDFRIAEGAMLASAGRGGLEGLTLRGGPLGVQAILLVNIPESGLYTISALGLQGNGQSWLLDSCGRAVLCDSRTAASPVTVPEWRDVTTTTFSAGPHYVTVTLGNGATVERVRVQRKKDTPGDYVATLARLGFDLGETDPVARARAVEAMNFIHGRRRKAESAPCDVLIEFNPTQRTVLAEPAAPVVGPTIPLNPGPGQPPLGPPIVPPQEPASPVLPSS
jgi:hypothetical protein